jgi:hypothetical protein
MILLDSAGAGAAARKVETPVSEEEVPEMAEEAKPAAKKKPEPKKEPEESVDDVMPDDIPF